MKCECNPKSDDESKEDKKEDESVTGGDEKSEQLTTDPAPKETHRQTDAEDEDNTFVVDVGDNSSCIVKSDAQLQIHAEENNFVEEQKNQDDTSDQKRLTDANEDSEVERLIDQATQKMKMEDQEIMQKSLATDVTDETADFKVHVDLSHYNPENIRVLFRDGHIIVEADREIKGDNYRQTENFCRRIRIPETVDESTLKSFLSNERFMTILAWSKRGGNNEETFPVETDGVMVHS